MAMVVGDEAMSLHSGGVVFDPEAAGYVPSYDQCQYYYHHQCTTELPVGDAGSAVAHHDVDGWVLHAAAATSPSSSSVLTFDGLGEEDSAASWWMDMDMDAHGTVHLIGHGHGPTTAASSSSSCFSSGSSGDSGMVTTTSTNPRSTASASQKRPRTPPSPSQGAELHEYSKKQRANNKEPQSSAAKSRRERISERLRALRAGAERREGGHGDHARQGHQLRQVHAAAAQGAGDRRLLAGGRRRHAGHLPGQGRARRHHPLLILAVATGFSVGLAIYRRAYRSQNPNYDYGLTPPDVKFN